MIGKDLHWYLAFIVLSGWISLAPKSVRAQSEGLPQPERITQREGLPQAFVPAITQDRQGFIWVGTLDGLCRYDGNEFKVYRPASPLQVRPDNWGRLWLKSEHDLDWFDPATETFHPFTRHPFFRKHFPQEHIRSFFVENPSRIWLGLAFEGLVSVDLATHRFRRFRHQPGNPHSLSNDMVKNIVIDYQKRLWVATDTGLDRFDESTGRFVHLPLPTSAPDYKPDSSIIGLYLKPDGDLLLLSGRHLTVYPARTGPPKQFRLPKSYYKGIVPDFATDSQGNDYITVNDLYRFNERTGPQLLYDSTLIQSCQSIYIDRSDVLWLGTQGAGIRKYNLRSSRFTALPYRVGFPSDLFTRILGMKTTELSTRFAKTNPYNFRYTYDRQGKLWFSAGPGNLYRLDLRTKLAEMIPQPAGLPDKPDGKPVLLTSDPQGGIWLAHRLKAWQYDELHRTWHAFPFPIRRQQANERQSIQMIVDERFVWVLTGSDGFFRTDRKTGTVRHYTHQPGDSTSLSSNNLTGLVADLVDPNKFWIGTYGSGLCLFDKQTGRVRRLTQKDGLPNEVIYTAIPDRRGFVWVATNQGLCQLNRKTFQTRVYTYEDGLQADEFNRFHQLELPDGRIILGGLEGLTAFKPDELQEDTYQPEVQLTDIQINNRMLEPGSLTNNRAVHTLDVLDLSHNQNFVTASFAAMQFNRRSKIRFRYQLEGLDPDWIVTERPIAVYTDLRPGYYTLKLNASNTSAVWSSHVRTVSVIVHRPWWTTWWALMLYFLLLAGIAYGLIRMYLNRIRLRQSMELQEKKAEQLRLLDEMKTRFFSNITHEFRTPITLIMTPTEQLLNRFREPEDRRRLNTISQNANQLLDLVNQLLDLSKLEAGAVKTDEARGDLREFVEIIVQSFQPEAEERGIMLRFLARQLAEEYWFDKGKLERIVYNLVANALKFTPSGGQVECLIEMVEYKNAEVVKITVRDSGIGISPNHLPHIFDRFYQVEDSASGLLAQKQQGGTGIGLSLVKEFVELQGGAIQLKSEPGDGTEFAFFLPYRPAAPPLASTANLPAAPGEEREGGIHLLIVEDNQELTMYIAESFPDSYHIRRAANGADGLALALEHMPDLIISDVLMPIMDGYTLVRKLKEDLRVSHIPVILLTAKSAHESRLEGLTAGANDYITKPFHLEELRLRVRNLLEQQRQFRDWVRASLINPDTPVRGAETTDSEPFLEVLYPILETNLDNSAFGVEELTTQMRMSRMSFYRKTKAVTGLSTNELIRNYRLKRATYFLREGFTSTETAYRVGFDSPAYFTKCFRELYQMTPTEFVAKGGMA
ncbi:hybrid sensor histidine kinase/response regulator transcription factor [Larkinella rosea]|uniref:histidine kinase n=1 Tax=Larkinella rosea TaxID=2025312 RepID=A0A3P1C3X9_9BACT|nr:ATP-binding protein [Larkinella rosea]RRB07823.1 hybrid sensor histidine kinase/response regulator [Larkinella rosea]